MISQSLLLVDLVYSPMRDAYRLTVYENDTSLNATVSFVAMDVMNASSLLDPQVLVCACQNGGNCTLEGILDQDADPFIMNCVCTEGMRSSIPLTRQG